MSTQGTASFKESTSRARVRNVTINPLPHVECYVDKEGPSKEDKVFDRKVDTSLTYDHIKHIDDMATHKDLTYLFYSNVSYLSRSVKITFSLCLEW